MTSQGQLKPLAYEVIDNARVIYRLHIQDVTKQERERSYQWDEIEIYQPISKDKITEAVIEMFYPKDIENKLINNYNGAKLNFFDEDTNAKYIQEYQDFLLDRQEIKQKIKEDCSTFGIR